MNKQFSEMDKQLRSADRMSIFFAIELNKVRRNGCILFGIISLSLIQFFAWSKWFLLVPATLVFGVIIFQWNIAVFSSELKRRNQVGG